VKRQKIDIQEAISRGLELPYAMIRSLSRVILGKTPQIIDTDELDELIEARFFSETEEVRLFYREGEMCAVHLTEEQRDNLIRRTYDIANPLFGGTLTVSSDIIFDDDGQAMVRSVRLSGWTPKGVTDNG
jgi:hypothetical protein